jgi:hypothetical protein
MTTPISDLSQLSQDALASFHKALSSSKAQQGDPRIQANISKAISQSTGLVWYDLQAPAKQLFPVLTPLRNKIPRVPGNGGTATNWIAVNGINTAALRGFVPEGRRNGTVTTSTVPKSAAYAGVGLEDSVTFEAEYAAENFENIRATTAQRLLWATMIEEELGDLGANNSLALGTPTLVAPAFTPSDSAVLGDGTYYCNVIALTLHGFSASSLANGVVGTVTVNSADGSGTYTYGGGSSAPSAQGSVATTKGTKAGSFINLQCTPVPGAVAYAWFVSTTTGHARLQAITTTNVVQLGGAALSTTSQDVSTLPGTDQSKNAYAYDGLISQAFASASGAYIKTLAADTTGFKGNTLTSNGAGGIKELDVMFQDRWDNYRLPVDELWVSSQEALTISKLVLGNGGATYPIMHMMIENDPQSAGNIVGGGRVKSILNNFAMAGRVDVPINIHPNLPAGTIMGITWSLPYPVNEVPNVIEKKLRRDYYQMEWPLRTRKYESGVYFDGVLACYFPPALSFINNIAPL